MLEPKKTLGFDDFIPYTIFLTGKVSELLLPMGTSYASTKYTFSAKEKEYHWIVVSSMFNLSQGLFYIETSDILHQRIVCLSRVHINLEGSSKFSDEVMVHQSMMLKTMMLKMQIRGEGISSIPMNSIKHPNIRILSKPNCRQLIVVFTGKREGVFADPLQFVSSCRIIDRNLMFFRDPEQCYYFNGVGYGVRSIKDIIVFVQAFLKESPWIDKVYCFGSSAACPVALILGHSVHAEEVICFALPKVTKKVFARGMARIRLFRNVNAHPYMKAYNGHTVYKFFYNESYESDRESAMKFKEYGDSRFFPLNGEGHAIKIQRGDDNLLFNLFPPFLGVDTGDS